MVRALVLVRVFCVSAALLVFVATTGVAQDLTPRSYWPAPEGTRLVLFGYAYSSGDVLFDPSLPISGVDSKIHNTVAAYLQTFSLWGRTTHMIVELPYTWGTTEGEVAGESRRRDLSGFGDLGVTLSVNLLGAPTMSRAGFQELRSKPRPMLGASLKVLAPTGDYESDKLVNVGAHRWAAKVELGFMIPMKPKWLLELEVGSWFFADNDDFLGLTRKQDPIVAAELHVVKRFRPGFWASLEANYFSGGRSSIGDQESKDRLSNSRIGATIVIPFRGRQAVKLGWKVGFVTKSGGDARVLLVSYQRILGKG